MSSTLVARMSSPAVQAARHATFSTSATFLKPLAAETAPSASVPAGTWRWTNLSPKTRRYVVVGLAISTCVDTWVLYNYWPKIFGAEEVKN
ncbi:Fc.00g039340.m01.CDS01 [Cosmosporella sp. VM-42]